MVMQIILEMSGKITTIVFMTAVVVVIGPYQQRNSVCPKLKALTLFMSYVVEV